MSDKDVARFNERATHYETDWLGRNVHQQVRRRALDLAAAANPAPAAILDVGCGTGALLRAAADRFPAATRTGIDAAAQMIKIASEADPAARLLMAPAEDLPFDDDAFDLVVSSNSFHHWPDQQAGIAEIGRVLRRGGALVLVDPFAIGLLRPWSVLIGKADRMRTKADVEAMLAAAELGSARWDPVLGFGPLPMIHAVTASSSR
jgi:ubiquinone/menaquinone biosynthesis C-methylase UbiE